MSMISEQVKKIRSVAGICTIEVKKTLLEAADTIEALSKKVLEENVDRPERYYEVRKELVEQHNKAFDLINKMPLEGNEVWNGYVGGVMQTLGDLINYTDDRP